MSNPYQITTISDSFEVWIENYNSLCTLADETYLKITSVQDSLIAIEKVNIPQISLKVIDLESKYNLRNNEVIALQLKDTTNSNLIYSLQTLDEARKSELSTLTVDSQSYNDRIVNIENVNLSINTKLTQIESTNDSIDTRITAIEGGSTSTVNTYVNQLQLEDASLSALITALDGDVTQIDNDLLALDTKNSQLNTNLTSVNNDNKGLDTRIQQLEAQSSIMPDNAYQKLIDKDTLFTTTISTLSTDNTNITTSITTLTTQHNNIATNITSLQATDVNLGNRITSLETNLNNPSAKIVILQTNDTALDLRVAALENDNATFNTQQANLTSSYNTINTTVNTVVTDNATLTTQLTGLNTSVNSNATAITAISSSDIAINSRITALELARLNNQIVVDINNESNILMNSLTLNGTLNSMGGEASIDCGFIYRTLNGLFQYSTLTPLSSTGTFSANVIGLQGGTEYEVYAYAVASGNQYRSQTSIPKIIQTAYDIDLNTFLNIQGYGATNALNDKNAIISRNGIILKDNTVIGLKNGATVETIEIAQTPVTDPVFKKLTPSYNIIPRNLTIDKSSSLTDIVIEDFSNSYSTSDKLIIDDLQTIHEYNISAITQSNKSNDITIKIPETGFGALELTKDAGFYILSSSSLTNKIYTSSDLLNWNEFNTSQQYKAYNNVTLQNGLWFQSVDIVGIDYLYSGSNLNNLNKMTLPSTHCGKGKVIYDTVLMQYILLDATPNTNKIFVSSNGMNWSLLTSNITYSSYNNIQIVNGLYFIANSNSGNKLLQSIDGITWTSITLSSNYNSYKQQITFDGVNYLLIDETIGSTISFTSTDALTWVQQAITATSSATYNIVINNGIYVKYFNSIVNNIEISTDGLVWTAEYLPTQCLIKDIKFLDNMYILLGSNGNNHTVILTSTSLLNFDVKLLSKDDNLTSEHYLLSNGTYVLVDRSKNKIRFSADYINWTDTYLNSTQKITSNIVDGAGKYIICAGNYILYSTDLITWTEITPDVTCTFNVAPVYKNSTWLLCDSSPNTTKIFTSVNAIVWTQQTLPNMVTISANPSFISTKWILLDSGTTNTFIYTSPDLITWTQVDTLIPFLSSLPITFDNNLYIITDTDINTKQLITSPNLTTWTQRLIPSTAVSVTFKSNPVYSNSVFVLTNSELSSSIFTSSNGITWTERTITGTYASNTKALYTGSNWVIMDNIVGTVKLIQGNNVATAWLELNTSYTCSSNQRPIYNGSVYIFPTLLNDNKIITFNQNLSTISTIKTYNVTGFTFNNIDYNYNSICLSIANSCNFVLLSFNKTCFYKITTPNVVDNGKISYTINSYFLTDCSGSNRLYSSTDGLIWNTVNLTSAYIGNNHVTSINGNYIIVDGTTLSSKTFYSIDGITWNETNLGTTFTINDKVTQAYGMGIFTDSTVGSNKYFTTADGITWNTRTFPIALSNTKLCYGNGVLIVVDSTSKNTIYSSTNGINWTLRTLGSTCNCTCPIYDNGLFLLADSSTSSNKYFTSADGITWNVKTTGTNFIAEKVVFMNGTWIILDKTNLSFLTSTDLIIWTAHTLIKNMANKNAKVINGILYTGSGVVNSNSLSLSIDGITFNDIYTQVNSKLWNLTLTTPLINYPVFISKGNYDILASIELLANTPVYTSCSVTNITRSNNVLTLSGNSKIKDGKYIREAVKLNLGDTLTKIYADLYI